MRQQRALFLSKSVFFSSNRSIACHRIRINAPNQIARSFSVTHVPAAGDQQCCQVKTFASHVLPVDDGGVGVGSSLLKYSDLPPSDSVTTDHTVDTLFATSSQNHVPAFDIPWWDATIYVTDVVHWIHDTTGMPYALSIAAVTVLGRCFMVPIAIWHLRNNPWEPDLAHMQEKFDSTQDPLQKQRYKAQFDALRASFPARNRLTLPLASLGSTFFMWFGLRRMSTLYPDEMSEGGIAWFMDLTQPDPFLFLPIVSNVLFFAMQEMGADEMGRPRKEIPNKLWLYALRGFQGMMALVWFLLPSSILCFWIPHSAISCFQTAVFSQPTMIRRLGFGRAGKKPQQAAKITIYDTIIADKMAAKSKTPRGSVNDDTVQKSAKNEEVSNAIRLRKTVGKAPKKRRR